MFIWSIMHSNFPPEWALLGFWLWRRYLEHGERDLAILPILVKWAALCCICASVARLCHSQWSMGRQQMLGHKGWASRTLIKHTQLTVGRKSNCLNNKKIHTIDARRRTTGKLIYDPAQRPLFVSGLHEPYTWKQQMEFVSYFFIRFLLFFFFICCQMLRALRKLLPRSGHWPIQPRRRLLHFSFI